MADIAEDQDSAAIESKMQRISIAEEEGKESKPLTLSE